MILQTRLSDSFAETIRSPEQLGRLRSECVVHQEPLPNGTSWAVDDTVPAMTQAEAVAGMNHGPKDEIDRAFEDGVVVDYERRYVGKDNSDVEIKIVLRHRSAIKPAV